MVSIMNTRDKIDYNTIKDANRLLSRAFNSAIYKISLLNSNDIKDVVLINNIVKTEFDNISLLLSDDIYNSTKEQYYNAIKNNQMIARKLNGKFNYKFNTTDKTMLDIFDDGGSLFISNIYNNNLEGKMVDELKKMISEGKSLKDTKTDIANLLQITNNKALNQISNFIVTNNTWTRSIATTNLLERAGATKYKYLVVLDSKTSPICRALAGKEVSVDKAIKLRDEYINIPRNDYDKFKENINNVSPLIAYNEETEKFYYQSEKNIPYNREYYSDEILDMKGMALPPLHIGCRTEIQIVY